MSKTRSNLCFSVGYRLGRGAMLLMQGTPHNRRGRIRSAVFELGEVEKDLISLEAFPEARQITEIRMYLGRLSSKAEGEKEWQPGESIEDLLLKVYEDLAYLGRHFQC